MEYGRSVSSAPVEEESGTVMFTPACDTGTAGSESISHRPYESVTQHVSIVNARTKFLCKEHCRHAKFSKLPVSVRL